MPRTLDLPKKLNNQYIVNVRMIKTSTVLF